MKKLLQKLYEHNILIRYAFYICVWIATTVALFISQIAGDLGSGINNAWLTFWMIVFTIPLFYMEYITINKRLKNNINIYTSIKNEEE